MKYWLTSLFTWLAIFFVAVTMILVQQTDGIELAEIWALKENYLMVLGCFGMIVLVVHVFWLFSLKNNK
ncbi:MAG: hypothetical protein HDR42_00895 [Lactobacillus sp.]|nr:hypothetical protein [Lactobacillus sp.]